MIIFLQNAWSPVYAGTIWPRRSWLRALASSPSGRRLKLLTDDLSVVHNVSPICGLGPSSVMTPDEKHVTAILEICTPRVVVACGTHAERTLVALWKGPLLALPHPAYRVLTNALYEYARKLIEPGFNDRLRVRQLRNSLHVEPL